MEVGAIMKFATCLNCIDGRTHLPLIDWIKTTHNIEYVDLITEPAMLELLSHDINNNRALIDKIRLSLEKHKPTLIIAAGHYDCAACTKNNLDHKKDIGRAVENITQLFPGIPVCGLWVNENWTVEEIVSPEKMS
jgi:carbonic anhydrase